MIKYLVLKYLRFDKTQPFITLCAILAFLGVSIGLMVLIVAMAIMNGFDKEFERKLFTMNYPITIISYFKGGITNSDLKSLETKFPHITFSPYITSQVIVKSANKLEGGVMFGVNLEKEKKINSVVKEGAKDSNLTNYGVMLGKGLKDEFLLSDEDKITMIFTKMDPGGFSMIPKMKRFDVRADFSSGLIAYDKAYIYSDINDLAKILGYDEGNFDGIHIYSDEPFKDKELITAALPSDNMKILGWWEQNGNFFAALALEKRALFIVLMLIILVASLNIISSLLMTVMNRRQEIALMLSLGASKKEVKNVFFSLGMVIGGGGIIFGLILGLFGVWLFGSFDIIDLPADVYGSSKLPMELSAMDLVMILVGATIIVILSSYYPAKKATQIDVLQTLRNE